MSTDTIKQEDVNHAAWKAGDALRGVPGSRNREKIFAEGELNEHSVVKKFFTTAADGKQYETLLYNLDAIVSVGYRVKSTGGA